MVSPPVLVWVFGRQYAWSHSLIMSRLGMCLSRAESELYTNHSVIGSSPNRGHDIYDFLDVWLHGIRLFPRSATFWISYPHIIVCILVLSLYIIYHALSAGTSLETRRYLHVPGWAPGEPGAVRKPRLVPPSQLDLITRHAQVKRTSQQSHIYRSHARAMCNRPRSHLVTLGSRHITKR